MCGIAGFQGTFEPGLLERMTGRVAHRGPDGQGGALLEGGGGTAVGLGHRRLAIIDLSDEGCQPMGVRCTRCEAEQGRLVLAYNGEVYNFAELRAELEGRGHAFRSRTDSEVLLHLYAEHGTAMVERLNGIFAFALYDGREAGRPAGVERGDLFLARDPLGVKPLYLAETPRGTLFASELKALLAYPELPRDLDPLAVHYHLAYLWAPAPHTVLRSVRKLRPGEACLVRGGRVARRWRYYRLPYGGERLEGTEAEIATELRERVARAVDRQMMSDVPVGAFLSGGLDSSAVVAMMRRSRPDHRPVCYTIRFAGEEAIDGAPADAPYARRVAAHLGVELREVEVDAGMVGQLERMLFHLDEPQADPAPINALLIAEQARRDGIPVLLSGAGGDDIFSGYRRHRALGMERLWGWMPRSARRPLARAGAALGAGRGGSLRRRVGKAFAHADLEGGERMASYFWWSGEGLRRGLYTPALAEQLASASTALPLVESLREIPAETDPLNRMLFLETRHFLADHNLNYTDKVGMAVGVEVRVPLLDLELVEFAARIPPGLKQRGAVGKHIFKRAMEPLLPHDVIYRPKTGFGAPLRRWLDGELRGMVEDTLSPAALSARGLFDPAAVAALVRRDRAGQVDGAYTIFALMCLELWCRIFVDRGGEAPA
jgi:asparagine synthase (glutamine-hydrolysing)